MSKIWLSLAHMGGSEQEFVREAFETNWVVPLGPNVDGFEHDLSQWLSTHCDQEVHAVALSSGTAAIHLALIMLGVSKGDEVICQSFTFAASANPICYQGATPIFVDSEPDTWNMDPILLEQAICDRMKQTGLKPKAILPVHLYGTPARMNEICDIASRYGIPVVEDAAEAMGAVYDGRYCGTFGQYGIFSFNGNKMITGSSGGCLLTNELEVANKARKWSTQARENAAWYLHEEVGYNYRMSNVIAGVIRGQYPYLAEHLEQKKVIYKRYEQGLKGLPVRMNPIVEGCSPNYWLSAMIIDSDAMCKQVRSDTEALYLPEHGKSCPTEILEAISGINAEGRPIWRPMSCQPMYRQNAFIGRNGNLRAQTNAYIAGGEKPIGWDIFDRGLCLPSDNKMTEEQQDRIIQVIQACFE